MCVCIVHTYVHTEVLHMTYLHFFESIMYRLEEEKKQKKGKVVGKKINHFP